MVLLVISRDAKYISRVHANSMPEIFLAKWKLRIPELVRNLFMCTATEMKHILYERR
jgi:hypothetical protein